MLGDTIRNLRNTQKITQRELASILNISTSTVGMYEQNRRTPDNNTLIKIANYFGVSVDYLLGYEPLKEIVSTPVPVNPLTNKPMTKRELNQYDKVINEVTLIFNDKKVPEEDKEKLMLALNNEFWKSKNIE